MSDTSAQPVWTPTCALCNSLVQLETCKTDEHGTAVHEECYVRKILLARAEPQFSQNVRVRRGQWNRRGVVLRCRDLREGCGERDRLQFK
jgi:hypothetical protein